LANAIPKTLKVAIAAMQVQSEKAEIFQVGKRNITSQKMIDSLSNSKLHCSLIINESIVY
jgi:hypothetical protein